MRVIRTSDTAACLTAVLSMMAYGLAASPLILVGASAIALGEWLWVRAKPEFQLPRPAANFLVIAAVAWAVWSAIQEGVDVSHVADLIVLLLLVKLLDRRTARDAGQILSLSVFLSIGAVLTSNAFLMGVTLVAVVPLLVGATVLHQVRLGLERYVQAGGGREGAVAGRRPAPAIARVVVVGSLGAAAVGLVVFLLMPRGIGANAFGKMTGTSLGRATGFTDTVRLGKPGLISQSSEIVLDLRITDAETGVPLGGPGEVWYLRGAVLDEYADGEWQKIENRAATASAEWMPDQPLPLSDKQHADMVQHVTIRNAARGTIPLFACWRPASLTLAQAARIEWNEYDKSIYAETEGGAIEYDVLFATDERREPRFGPRSTTARPQSEAILEIANRVLEEAGIDPDPETRPTSEDGVAARAIESFLREEFDYTLDILAAPAGQDPIVWFLQDVQEGHCEYFASAMTAMARAVGINARVVTGYVATRYDAATGHYIVREGNAHAWVEVEHGRNRWRTFDPTPPDDFSRIHQSEVGLIGRIRGLFRSAEIAWINAVVAYDEQTREQLLSTTTAPAEALAPLNRLGLRLRFARSSDWLRAVVVGIGVFAGTAAMLILIEWIGQWALRLLKRWRTARRAIREDPSLPRRRSQMKLYQDLLALLARRGHPKPAGVPPLAHSRKIADADPELAALAERVSTLYYRVRFGREVLPAEQIAEARTLIERQRTRPRS